MWKPILAISRQGRGNTEAIMKNCELFIYLFIYDITNLICKNVLN
jgi:hypothetical protein